MKKRNSAIYLSRGGLIAALYVVITWVCSLMGLSSGVIQFRFSEALCILPVFMPEAVPALFVGCFISNIISGGLIWDVIFGSVATLIGAIGARAMRKLPCRLMWLATLPTVLSNAVIIPFVLIYTYGAREAWWFISVTVAIGEIVCATVGGYLLYRLLNRSSFISGLKP